MFKEGNAQKWNCSYFLEEINNGLESSSDFLKHCFSTLTRLDEIYICFIIHEYNNLILVLEVVWIEFNQTYLAST